MIFITHNVHHAYPVGDAFTILNRGRTYGTFPKADVSREEVLNMMVGRKELDELSAELEEFARTDATGAGAREHASPRNCTAGPNLSTATNAADVVLKERRPLVLMLRETSLHAGHLEKSLKPIR